jgi:tetratricopeptide (TPR) repeat protein
MITALDYAEKAVNAQSAAIAVENYIKILIQTEKLESAIANANRFIESSQGNERGLELKTIALIKLKNFQDAEKSALKLIKKDPFNTRYLMYFGLIHSSLLNFEKADYYLSRAADRRTPDRLPIYLSLINNSINAEFDKKTSIYMERIFKIFTIHDIRQKIAAIQNETYPVFVISIQEIETRLNLYLEELIRTKKGNADEVLEEGRIDN